MRKSVWWTGRLLIAWAALAAAQGTASAQGLFGFGKRSTVVVGTPFTPPTTVVVPSHIVLRPTIVDPFQDALGRLRSRHNNSRRDGAITLGRIGDPRAVPDLVWLLQNDRDKDVRNASALALGAIGDARALRALRAAAVGDRNRRVRQSAHHALGKILFAAPVVEPATVIETAPTTVIETAPTTVIERQAPVVIESEPTLVDPEPSSGSVAPRATEPEAVPALPPPATELEPVPLPTSVPELEEIPPGLLTPPVPTNFAPPLEAPAFRSNEQ